jgi:hypothetical protein
LGLFASRLAMRRAASFMLALQSSFLPRRLEGVRSCYGALNKGATSHGMARRRKAEFYPMALAG